MMNNLLRDLIGTGSIILFIDNILVATNIEEGHDEILEEILKKIKVDDLYIKPEKCMQNARKVEFLK